LLNDDQFFESRSAAERMRALFTWGWHHELIAMTKKLKTDLAYSSWVNFPVSKQMTDGYSQIHSGTPEYMILSDEKTSW